MSVKLIHTSRFHGRFRLKYLDFSFLINIVSSFNLICQQWETTYIYRFLKISSLDKCLELLATLSSLTIKNLKKLEVKFRNRKKFWYKLKIHLSEEHFFFKNSAFFMKFLFLLFSFMVCMVCHLTDKPYVRAYLFLSTFRSFWLQLVKDFKIVRIANHAVIRNRYVLAKSWDFVK